MKDKINSVSEILKICLIFMIGLVLILLVGYSIQSELTESFNTQAAIEQTNLLEDIIDSNREELNEQASIWLMGDTSELLLPKNFEKTSWEGRLLGLANSTNFSFSSRQIITHDSKGKVINNYKTVKEAKQLPANDTRFQELLKEVITEEYSSHKFISLEDGTILQVVVYPIMNDEYTVTNFLTIVLDLQVIAKRFKLITTQDLMIINNNYKLSTKDNEKGISHVHLYERQLDFKKNKGLLGDLKITTLVDQTKQNKSISTILYKIIAFFSVIFTVFMLLYLRVNKNLKEQRAKSYESSRLASLGEMAGGIAHEINNPLTIIKANIFKLKLLHKKGDLKPEVFLETADLIISIVNRISQIVQSLKNVSRNEENSPMQDATTDNLVKDSIALSEQKLKVNAINFEYKNEVPDQIISCRQIEISRVLINLLNNANDAIMEANKPEKEIRINVFKDNEFVHFEVSDNGSGISEENKKKILTPFFTTKEVGAGTGLGLSLSLQVAKDHNGSLDIFSESGLTKFTLKIPIPTPVLSPTTEASV